MDPSASLKQTVTHLFDAVRHGNRAKDLEGAAAKVEGDLSAEVNRLESHIEEVTNLLESMREGTDEAVNELSRQVEEFLETARAQATEKLERKAREKVTELREAAASEKDRALKSLESYLASEPLPVVEKAVQVKLTEGTYEARSSYRCDGGIRFEFRLATQNSGFFGKEFSLSQLGYELRVPVRLSRTLLKKGTVPGFERLDQYVLENAETSGGKVRATFEKEGNGARIKVIASGAESDGFVGIEYVDQAHQVNVITDPTLSSHVDFALIRKAMGELASGVDELSGKKIALLGLSLGGEEALDKVDPEGVMRQVLKVMSPSYQETVKMIAGGNFDGDVDLTLDFLRERLKVLGGDAGPVAGALGFRESP